MEREQKRIYTTPQIMIIGFAAAILLGTFLLMMPFATADGTSTGFLDALFTATTSVCVTGLVTVPTFSHWSLFGKIVILILIQLGGLGVITVTLLLLVLLKRKITLKERLMIQDTYGLEDTRGLVKFVLRVVKGTFLVEGIGAVLLAVQFAPEYGWKSVWYGIFHSVSAFCNAGIDILGNNSLTDYVADPFFNLTIMLLIVSGGIGFVVWWDLIRIWREGKEHHYRSNLSRLNLHSKMALSVTAILILGGTIFTLLLEYNNPATIGTFSFPEKVLASAFQSVTTRTAGFLTIPQENFKDASALIFLVWMLIGGSPAGTAGGIKTTTVGMIFLIVWSQIRGNRDTEAFGRKISTENLKTAISVVVIFLFLIFFACLILFTTEDLGTMDLMYEICSAIGTVGLTRGITALLSPVGKVVIIFLMFCGRLGPITIAMALALKRRNTAIHRELPERKIIIG